MSKYRHHSSRKTPKSLLRFAGPNRFARPSRRPPLSLDRLDALGSSLLSHRLAPSTRDKYRASRRRWYAFCRLHRTSRTPTSRKLRRFVVHLIHNGIRSIPSILSGVADKYKHEVDWSQIRLLAQTKELAQAQRRVDPHRTKQANPLSPSDLVIACEETLEDDRRDKYSALLASFILGIAFTGLMRLGEAVFPAKREYFELPKYAKRSSFHMTDLEITFELPYHKGANDYTTTFVAIRRELIPSSLPLFEIARAFITARDRLHPPGTGNDLLFASSNGELLSRDYVVKILKSVGDYSGHSLRSGGATYLARIGIKETEIQRCGRWTSAAFSKYIREHAGVLAALRSWAAGLRLGD